MHLVAIAWIYVVLMMAVVEALSSQGTVLGALITFTLYGVLPLGIVMYLLGAPGRRRLRRRAEEAELQALRAAAASAADPDAGGETPRAAVAAERKET
jgi:mannose/fructose/N-acetylgalactosamine-specific phosphotransferase system component IID